MTRAGRARPVLARQRRRLRKRYATLVATMKDDGTLEGELSTNRGRTKWTGERLKKP